MSTQAITYNLKSTSIDSNLFFKKLVAFSRIVHLNLEKRNGELISNYLVFIRKNKIESLRSREEYSIELLTIAMVWRRYLGASQNTGCCIVKLLTFLYALRTGFPSYKSHIDRLRGLLAGKKLVPQIGKTAKDEKITIKNVTRLINWLEATGEFKDEVKRFKLWLEYFITLPENVFADSIKNSLVVFDWFKLEAQKKLGEFTIGVADFLQNSYPAYRMREDEIFCGKEAVEYHVNMVASEIMNWGFRREFLQKTKRAVLVPACMCAKTQKKCKASFDQPDIICGNCCGDCRVHQLTRLGKKENFEVFIIPHSSGFTRWLKRWENTREYGLVAVACLLNIVVGGYEMRNLNIPSQCVPLDYSGCKKHWHKDGIPTELNSNQLLKILNLEKGCFQAPSQVGITCV